MKRFISAWIGTRLNGDSRSDRIKWRMRWLGWALTAALAPAAAAQEHYHFNVGAQSQVAGTPLYFQNGGSFVTNSGFALPLRYAASGTQAGYFATHGFSPTAIGTGFFAPPAPGTLVRLRFVTVSGPAGGRFGVWDVPGFNYEEEDAGSLTFNIPAGTTNGTQSLLLSQHSGEPGADPFGHIHGRAFSADQPGLYIVSVQAYDASANGPGGGPIHTNSEVLPIYFQAGITIAGITRTNTVSTLVFATALGRTYFLQSTTNLNNPQSWQDIAGPIAGNNSLHTVTDNPGHPAAMFYRLRTTLP